MDVLVGFTGFVGRMTPPRRIRIKPTHSDNSGVSAPHDRTGVFDPVGTCQAALCAISSRALAFGFPHAIFAVRLMVFEATVYLRREYLAVLAAVDMRLTGYFFLWVIDVKRVLVRETIFKVGRF